MIVKKPLDKAKTVRNTPSHAAAAEKEMYVADTLSVSHLPPQ